MARPRAADDFAAIRARMEELQRERDLVSAEQDHDSVSGPGAVAAGKPGLLPAIRRALLKASAS